MATPPATSSSAIHSYSQQYEYEDVGEVETLDEPLENCRKTVYVGQHTQKGAVKIRSESISSESVKQDGKTGGIGFITASKTQEGGFIEFDNTTQGVENLIISAKKVAQDAEKPELEAAIDTIKLDVDNKRLRCEVIPTERPFGLLQDIAEQITQLLEDETISQEVKLIAVKQLASNKTEFSASSSYRAMHTLEAERTELLAVIQKIQATTVKELADAFIDKNPCMLQTPTQGQVRSKEDVSQALVDLVAADIGIEATAEPKYKSTAEAALKFNVSESLLTEFYQMAHVVTTPAVVCQKIVLELEAALLPHVAQTNLAENDVNEHVGLADAIEKYELLTGLKVFSEPNPSVNVQKLHDNAAVDVAGFMNSKLCGVAGEQSTTVSLYIRWGVRAMDRIMTVGAFKYFADSDDHNDQVLGPITPKYLETCDFNDDIDSPMLAVALQAIDQTTDWTELLTFERRIKEDQSSNTQFPPAIRTLLLHRIDKQLVAIGQTVPLDDFIEQNSTISNIEQVAAKVSNADQALKILNRAYNIGANPSAVINALPTEIVSILDTEQIKDLSSQVKRVLVQFAIEKNELRLMEQLLNPCVNLNLNLKLHGTGFTPLYLAVKFNRSEIVNRLLEVKDRIEMVEEYHNNPSTLYHLCILEKNNGLLKQLIVQYVIDPNVVVERFGINKLRCPAIYLAAQEGNTQVVKMLLKEVDINVKLTNEEHYNALHAAARNGHAEIVTLLLPYWTPEELRAMNSDAAVPGPLKLASEHPSVTKLINDKMPGFFNLSSKSSKPIQKAGFVSQAGQHDYQSMSLWSRNKHVYTSIKTCDSEFTERLLDAGADILWKQDPEDLNCDNAFDTLIVWGGYIPLVKTASRFDTGIKDTEGNAKLSKEDKVRLKGVGDAIFAKLPQTDHGKVLKFDHFSHLMERLSDETVSALFSSIMSSAQSFEELMQISEKLEEFKGSTKYQVLKAAFFRNAQQYLSESRANRNSMIAHINHSQDPISLRKFLKISDDQKITRAIFERLKDLAELKREDFTENCSLDHIASLGADFLLQYGSVLPEILERVIVEDHPVGLTVLLDAHLDIDMELLNSGITPLEMACKSGCKHTAAILTKALSDNLKTAERTTALLGLAAKGGHIEIMRDLMWKFDIDPQKPVLIMGNEYLSPIQCAVKANQLEAAKLLLNESFLDTTDGPVSQRSLDNPINQAIMYRNKAMLTLLCSKHAVPLASLKLMSPLTSEMKSVKELTKEAIEMHETKIGTLRKTTSEAGKKFTAFVSLLSKQAPRQEESLSSEYADVAKLPVKSYCDDAMNPKNYSLRVRNQMLAKALAAQKRDAVDKLKANGAYDIAA
ncbi:ankyrin repeat domain-containing protein [Parashewanella spongiae]|uniref:Ankyrin repeat domain-containing protein n=1 Tax=Parashewanella spongiae TaxID=342950 RepID=A0A3A6U0U5_9GAMM|nr:ankyrin repeat domain-containing protein [Parashewanella spongiae]MCL1079671.1 ankyrin repeat domain-containing protein [Parashewanella spongiae]RJY18967.1 ankyrin repeat domain-containing protein [Parashewanella spongiae]